MKRKNKKIIINRGVWYIATLLGLFIVILTLFNIFPTGQLMHYRIAVGTIITATIIHIAYIVREK